MRGVLSTLSIGVWMKLTQFPINTYPYYTIFDSYALLAL